MGAEVVRARIAKIEHDADHRGVTEQEKLTLLVTDPQQFHLLLVGAEVSVSMTVDKTDVLRPGHTPSKPLTTVPLPSAAPAKTDEESDDVERT